MTTDEVNEDEVFIALVKHRLSDIDPKYVPGDAVANIADAYTEWRSGIERAAAEKAWARCVGEMPIDLDWKNFYGDNNPYRAAAYRREETE